jgi:hypothetical protein
MARGNQRSFRKRSDRWVFDISKHQIDEEVYLSLIMRAKSCDIISRDGQKVEGSVDDFRTCS